MARRPFARARSKVRVSASLLTIYRIATSHEGISLAGGYPAGELMPVERFARAMEKTLRRARHRGPLVRSDRGLRAAARDDRRRR